jgi:hypothetical protein
MRKRARNNKFATEETILVKNIWGKRWRALRVIVSGLLK